MKEYLNILGKSEMLLAPYIIAYEDYRATIKTTTPSNPTELKTGNLSVVS